MPAKPAAKEKKPQPIPEGYEGATPYLCVKGPAALDFYKKAFGATETMRMVQPDGRVGGHAEIRIGQAIIMVADEFPEMNSRSRSSLGRLASHASSLRG